MSTNKKVFVLTGDTGMISGIFSSREKVLDAIKSLVEFDDEHGIELYYADNVSECEVDVLC